MEEERLAWRQNDETNLSEWEWKNVPECFEIHSILRWWMDEWSYLWGLHYRRLIDTISENRFHGCCCFGCLGCCCSTTVMMLLMSFMVWVMVNLALGHSTDSLCVCRKTTYFQNVVVGCLIIQIGCVFWTRLLWRKSQRLCCCRHVSSTRFIISQIWEVDFFNNLTKTLLVATFKGFVEPLWVLHRIAVRASITPTTNLALK